MSSTNTRTTTTRSSVTSATNRPTQSSRRRDFLPLSEAIALTGKLLNPNLRPWRPFREPIIPSLRASQLPPPCAELDERPRRRVRRFMLWQDKVPPLRLVVLDPKKRVHLRRFNLFQIPSNPQLFRGIRTWSGDLKTHRSQVRPPTQSIPRTLHRAPPERVVRAVTPTGIVPAQAGGVIAPVISTPLPHVVNPSQPVVPSPATPRIHVSRTPSHPSTVRLPAAMGNRQVQRMRSTPESRRLDRAKLLQHLFVLEQQAERRWRLAMDFMVAKMLAFQQDHTVPSSAGDEKPVWAKDPDPAVIIQWLGFMSDTSIRKWGNVWPHLELAQRDLPEHLKIKPVKGLTQARQKVKEANQRREEIKKVKIAKIRAMREVKANAMADSMKEGAFIGPSNREAGPTMVIPRKASPALGIANPTPASIQRPTRTHLTKAHSSGSDSSLSERIITPPNSVAESSTKPETAPLVGTSPSKSHEMGLNPDIPEEIAHHLADMLTKFQAIGLERTNAANATLDESPPQITGPKENGGRRRRRARHVVKKTQDLEVSVDSDSTGSEVSDGVSLRPLTDKASEVGSWMTGDLNMDEDTRAMMSGAGTDTGSAL